MIIDEIETLHDIARGVSVAIPSAEYGNEMLHEVIERIACQLDSEKSIWQKIADERYPAWELVEKHGGIDAVKRRLMPEGHEWPRDARGVPIVRGETVWANGNGCADDRAAESELARIKDELSDFAEETGLNPEMDPRDLCERLRESSRIPRVAGVLCPDAGWKRLLEVIHQPPGAYRYRRQMTAAEAIWRIAKESYGARYETEEGGC
jgi:hypothetical protein